MKTPKMQGMSSSPVMGDHFFSIYIGECGSTLYVGLSGTVRNLIQSLRDKTTPFYPRAQASSVMESGWCPYTMSSKKIVIERTRDLIYLKFVATEFSPKIISPSAGDNSGDSA